MIAVCTKAERLITACRISVSKVEPLRQRSQPKTRPRMKICTMKNNSYYTCIAAQAADVSAMPLAVPIREAK